LNALGAGDRPHSEIGAPSSRLEMNRNRFRNLPRMNQVGCLVFILVLCLKIVRGAI